MALPVPMLSEGQKEKLAAKLSSSAVMTREGSAA